MKKYGSKPLRGKSRQSLLEAQSRFDRIDHTVIPQDKQTRCAHCHGKTTTRCEKYDIGVSAFLLYSPPMSIVRVDPLDITEVAPDDMAAVHSTQNKTGVL